MTHAERLAAFVVGASFDNLSESARLQLKIRILDSLGCAIGALQAEPVRLIRVNGLTERLTQGASGTRPSEGMLNNPLKVLA